MTARRAPGSGFVSVNTGGAMERLIFCGETEAVEETEASAASVSSTAHWPQRVCDWVKHGPSSINGYCLEASELLMVTPVPTTWGRSSELNFPWRWLIKEKWLQSGSQGPFQKIWKRWNILWSSGFRSVRAYCPSCDFQECRTEILLICNNNAAQAAHMIVLFVSRKEGNTN